ncbi:DgyrCDS509 [Dimorphilus gyrociliatus]|uniref:microtubule-severing ATPase n=1 Tax=Dimorphilus gyrociliatus TaxID=2664684 RepID=A0A7I8V630_9ANNE|nr:DgyrCDS509 [Dimorphilus gyrociliatus]
MSKPTPGPGEPALALQKHHHRKAFEYVSKALKLDEEDKGRKDLAVDLYKKGIEELEKGIAVDVSGPGDAFERARRLQEKMRTNLIMAKDRLQVLEVLLKTTKEDTSLCPANEMATKLAKDLNTNSNKNTKKSVQSPSSKIAKNVETSDRSTARAKMTIGIGGSRSSTLPRTAPRSNRNASPTTSPSMLRKQISSRTNPPNIRAPPNPNQTRQKAQNYLKNIDKRLANAILDEILESGVPLSLEDVAGLERAKQALQEMVILPSLRPELFTGLRTPARGLLLFGPPGNGKTLLAKAVAHESKSTFFNISAASITSKFVGEGEKLVRALFACAKELQPAVIFIDEVDSVLSQRSDNEHDAMRRLKTQFLLEFDGVSGTSERVVVMAATNRPYELDEAALRRFPKRVYVGMPDQNTRVKLLNRLLEQHGSPLSQREIKQISSLTEGYSASDLTELAKDAALGPIRELDPSIVKDVDETSVRKVNLNDFVDSLQRVRKSVPQGNIAKLQKWSEEFGDNSL